MKGKLVLLLLGLLLSGPLGHGAPLGTAFTYQGRLDQNGQPANGTYQLMVELHAGPVGDTLLRTNLYTITASNGLFAVGMDFGSLVFLGEERWLDLRVSTNGANQFVALTPRTRIAPTPNAIYASTAGTVNNGAIQLDQLGTVGAPPSAGQVLTYDGTALAWQGVSAVAGAWSVNGNSAAPGQFLGTTGNQPLEVRVNNARVARLEPTVGAPNVVLGSANNMVSNGVVAASIGGGEGNVVAGNHSVIAGGNANSCGSNAVFVGGGTINQADGSSSTLAGGYDNTVSGHVGFIGGGARNRATSVFSVVTGGENNTASGFLDLGAFGVAGHATVSGGFDNDASGIYSCVGGGANNIASGNYSTIPGGSQNWAPGNFSFAAGRRAKADARGAFVWADSSDADFFDSGDNTFSVRAQGGVRFQTQFLQVNGSANEGAYIGGDGAGGDVQLGSLNASVATVALYNAANNTFMNLGARDVSCRVLTIYGGADLAEPFPVKEEKIEKGSVVVIDDEHPGRLKRSTMAYDTRVAGIVSGANGINPGIALKQEGVLDQGENVALTGRVYVQADASFGVIKPGDLLTTSDTPGHAMKVIHHARAQGAILGKAMSALEEGTGLVLVLVTLQ